MDIKKGMVLVFAIVVTLFFLKKFIAPKNQEPTSPGMIAPAHEKVEKKLPGDNILSTYGSAQSDIKSDLQLMHLVLDNFSLIYKNDSPAMHGSNEEITAFLLGNNPQKLAFISPSCRALNANKQLIDRYGTALFFHAESGKKTTIYSAGVDKTMWTDDDVSREQNGVFHE